MLMERFSAIPTCPSEGCLPIRYRFLYRTTIDAKYDEKKT